MSVEGIYKGITKAKKRGQFNRGHRRAKKRANQKL